MLRGFRVLLAASVAFGACGGSEEDGGSSPPETPAERLCKAIDRSIQRCGGGPCDQALLGDCATLAGVLSDPFLEAAARCVEAGGTPADCLGAGLGGLEPTAGQQAFARKFCAECPPVPIPGCEDALLGGQNVPEQLAAVSKLLLPFGDPVLADLESQCLGGLTCIAEFPNCVQKVLAERALPAQTIQCVLDSLVSGGGAGTDAGACVVDGGAGTAGSTGSGGTPGAGGTSGSTGSGGSSGGGTGGSSGTGGTGGSVASCALGELATGRNGNTLSCSSIEDAVRGAFNQGCSIYLGWRDGCSGCGLSPSKWGRTSAADCDNGTGTNNTCSTATLDGQSVNLFGLNFDGTVDDNDTLYVGFRCPVPAPAPHPGPCGPGEFVVGVSGGSVDCLSLGGAVAAYAAQSCNVFVGWRDGCDACTSPPTKWGRVGDGSCLNGAGLHNTCTTPNLGGSTLNLFGLNFDGNVDGNDKIYVGLACAPETSAASSAAATCPSGQFVTGLKADGSVECSNALAQISAVIRSSCSLYLGWRDGCDDCVLPPEKWGRASGIACSAGVGADNTCSRATLDGTAVELFGLNTDGSVGDDDKLHVGLKCF
jgi:hypothetical protein